MHARIVRFSDVTAEGISEFVALILEEGPPAGLDETGIQVFFDEAHGTAVFVGYFETEQKMRDANAIFEKMDMSKTPGIRDSIDLCEVKLGPSAPWRWRGSR